MMFLFRDEILCGDSLNLKYINSRTLAARSYCIIFEHDERDFPTKKKPCDRSGKFGIG